MIKPDLNNFSQQEEATRLDNFLYDFQIYMIVPIQLFTLGYFLYSMQETGLATVDKTGRIIFDLVSKCIFSKIFFYEVLEDNKENVLEMKKRLDDVKIVEQDAALGQKADEAFYNTTKFTM